LEQWTQRVAGNPQGEADKKIIAALSRRRKKIEKRNRVKSAELATEGSTGKVINGVHTGGG
jgi:hypothetical protein